MREGSRNGREVSDIRNSEGVAAATTAYESIGYVRRYLGHPPFPLILSPPEYVLELVLDLLWLR